MITSADGWAVGYDGAISHWDGTRWNNIDSPTIANLRAVDMISPSEGWAIAGDIRGYGNNNSIIRWDGANWQNLSVVGSLEALHMSNSSDGWAVGAGALHWNGTSWALASS